MCVCVCVCIIVHRMPTIIQAHCVSPTTRHIFITHSTIPPQVSIRSVCNNFDCTCHIAQPQRPPQRPPSATCGGINTHPNTARPQRPVPLKRKAARVTSAPPVLRQTARAPVGVCTAAQPCCCSSGSWCSSSSSSVWTAIQQRVAAAAGGGGHQCAPQTCPQCTGGVARPAVLQNLYCGKRCTGGQQQQQQQQQSPTPLQRTVTVDRASSPLLITNTTTTTTTTTTTRKTTKAAVRVPQSSTNRCHNVHQGKPSTTVPAMHKSTALQKPSHKPTAASLRQPNTAHNVKGMLSSGMRSPTATTTACTNKQRTVSPFRPQPGTMPRTHRSSSITAATAGTSTPEAGQYSLASSTSSASSIAFDDALAALEHLVQKQHAEVGGFLHHCCDCVFCG